MDVATGKSSLRALDVFEAFRKAGRQLSLSELSRAAGIPVSTCHGVMRALEQRGFLYFLSPREVYPTRRLADIARDIEANDPVTARFEPALTALRDVTGETVILGTRHGDAVLYLLVLESGQKIRYAAHAGERKPLHSSSIGKVLLGTMTGEALSTWLSTHPLARITARTLTSRRRLQADLDASRERGYYVTRGENVADVMAIAVPVRQGGTTFGVAVAGPLHRMEAAATSIAERLRQCVRNLEKRDARTG
jgi:DNA-binding IclR family transcriptional regulator